MTSLISSSPFHRLFFLFCLLAVHYIIVIVVYFRFHSLRRWPSPKSPQQLNKRPFPWLSVQSYSVALHISRSSSLFQIGAILVDSSLLHLSSRDPLHCAHLPQQQNRLFSTFSCLLFSTLTSTSRFPSLARAIRQQHHPSTTLPFFYSFFGPFPDLQAWKMHTQSTKRISPPMDPPSFQRFRSIDDPDIPESITNLQIHQLNPNERIVYWADIELYFPRAHIILNGNTLVSPMRENLVV